MAGENGVALTAVDGRAGMICFNGDRAPDTVDVKETESPEPSDGHGEGETHRQHHSSSTKSVEVAIGEMGATAVGGIEPAEDTTADTQALVTMRRELERVKGAASGLESALRESRSEVSQLRELLATEENKTREQAGRLSSLRYPAVASSRVVM